MRKGMGTMVGIILITLVAIVGLSVFLGAYLRGIDQASSNEAALCFGVDLKLNNCQIIDSSIPLPPDITPLQPGYYALLITVERLPGGGEIKDLRFTARDASGNEHSLRPIDMMTPYFTVTTNYEATLIEYASVEAVVRDIPFNPQSVSVSAVVGESETICYASREPLRCVPFSL